MKLFATHPEDVDRACFDYWTAVHWASGTVGKSVFGLSRRQCFAFAVLWECFENSPLGKSYWSLLGEPHYDGDSACNILTDIATVMISFYSVKT